MDTFLEHTVKELAVTSGSAFSSFNNQHIFFHTTVDSFLCWDLFVIVVSNSQTRTEHEECPSILAVRQDKTSTRYLAHLKTFVHSKYKLRLATSDRWIYYLLSKIKFSRKLF